MEAGVVLSLIGFTEAQLEKLRRVAGPMEVVQHTGATASDLPAGLGDRVEVLYGWGKALLDAHRLPRLKWIQAHSAGVDFLLDTPVWESDVIITTASGIHPVPMAEHALAMMLHFRWRVGEMLFWQQRGEWPTERWDKFARPELRGSTLGIVGYGAIGRELGRLAKALGMRLLAANRSGTRHPFTGFTLPHTGDPEAALPEKIYPIAELTAMLPECDYVVVLAPLTPETRHLFNAETFAAMKPGAFFFNLARGGLVDEAALVEALYSGRIAGAGLDVFETEPLPADSPLWRLENVLISPHVAGFTPHYDERASDLFAENLRRYRAGEPLLNRVDRARGY